MKKGSIDIATLVVVMVPMAIFLIFSGQRLSRAAIDTELDASYTTGKQEFQGKNLAYQILHYRPSDGDEPLYKKITRYPNSDNQNSLKNTIKSRAKTILTKQSSPFKLKIEFPRTDEVITAKPDDFSGVNMNDEVAHVGLASAAKGLIAVKVKGE